MQIIINLRSNELTLITNKGYRANLPIVYSPSIWHDLTKETLTMDVQSPKFTEKYKTWFEKLNRLSSGADPATLDVLKSLVTKGATLPRLISQFGVPTSYLIHYGTGPADSQGCMLVATPTGRQWRDIESKLHASGLSTLIDVQTSDADNYLRSSMKTCLFMNAFSVFDNVLAGG